MIQTFEVLATQEEKKNYIMNKIMKLDALSRDVVGSRNTAEALAILDNLSNIGITKQEEQQVNQILKNNSNGLFTFGRRVPNFKYSVQTPFQDYYLTRTQSDQQKKKPIYIGSPSNVKMNNKSVNQKSFTKQKIDDFRGASIGAPPPPKLETAQEMIRRFNERNRRTKQKQKNKTKKV